ncbi:MAG: hypothetical protein Q7R34_15695 [Dehalococcoidia bacterium]|nr:hypothetical protein [Dehalococcoidia bacterium]
MTTLTTPKPPRVKHLGGRPRIKIDVELLRDLSVDSMGNILGPRTIHRILVQFHKFKGSYKTVERRLKVLVTEHEVVSFEQQMKTRIQAFLEMIQRGHK